MGIYYEYIMWQVIPKDEIKSFSQYRKKAPEAFSKR